MALPKQDYGSWFNIVVFHGSHKVPKHGEVFQHLLVAQLLQHQNSFTLAQIFLQCTSKINILTLINVKNHLQSPFYFYDKKHVKPNEDA